MPTNCWKTDSARPIQTMVAILPVAGTLRSCQDGSFSRSIDSRIFSTLASMLTGPSRPLRIALASGTRCLAIRYRGDSGMVSASSP